MIQIPSEADYVKVCDSISEFIKKHNDLVNLFKENTDAIGKIQDELQEMPGGYRNSQDIKNLKGRIEKLESTSFAGFDGRVSALAGRVSGVEECCKNTVAAGKALEGKVQNLERQYGETFEFVRNSVGNLREKVKEVLRTL